MDFNSKELQLDEGYDNTTEDVYTGGSEYLYTPSVTGGLEGKFWSSCIVSLFVVVFILLLFNYLSRTKKRVQRPPCNVMRPH